MKAHIFRWMLVLGVSAVACGDSNASPGSEGGRGGSGGSSGAGAAAGGVHPGGCSSSGGAGGQGNPPRGELAINEVMSRNEGAWIDEAGEADDWIELVNRSDGELALDDYALRDGSSQVFALPARALAPGETVLLWVDSDPSQGSLHAPWFAMEIESSGSDRSGSCMSSRRDRIHLATPRSSGIAGSSEPESGV